MLPSHSANPAPALLPTPTSSPKNVLLKQNVTSAQMDARRVKGLCIFCEAKYFYGHRCYGGGKSQLYQLQLIDDAEEGAEEIDTGQHEEEEVITEMAQISLHALTGVVDYQTLRITAHKGTRSLQVLMDTGSTHNFLNYQLAVKLGCKMVSRAPMSVKVGGGTHVICDSMVQNFEWSMKGLLLSADVFLIPLGGCDLVLGVQWFTTLGKVQFDFNTHN